MAAWLGARMEDPDPDQPRSAPSMPVPARPAPALLCSTAGVGERMEHGGWEDGLYHPLAIASTSILDPHPPPIAAVRRTGDLTSGDCCLVWHLVWSGLASGLVRGDPIPTNLAFVLFAWPAQLPCLFYLFVPPPPSSSGLDPALAVLSARVYQPVHIYIQYIHRISGVDAGILCLRKLRFTSRRDNSGRTPSSRR